MVDQSKLPDSLRFPPSATMVEICYTWGSLGKQRHLVQPDRAVETILILNGDRNVSSLRVNGINRDGRIIGAWV